MKKYYILFIVLLIGFILLKFNSYSYTKTISSARAEEIADKYQTLLCSNMQATNCNWKIIRACNIQTTNNDIKISFSKLPFFLDKPYFVHNNFLFQGFYSRITNTFYILNWYIIDEPVSVFDIKNDLCLYDFDGGELDKSIKK